jgi:hypothetical protein
VNPAFQVYACLLHEQPIIISEKHQPAMLRLPGAGFIVGWLAAVTPGVDSGCEPPAIKDSFIEPFDTLGFPVGLSPGIWLENSGSKSPAPVKSRRQKQGRNSLRSAGRGSGIPKGCFTIT